MLRAPRFGSLHLLFFLLLMMTRSCSSIRTTISQFETSDSPFSTDRLDYSTTPQEDYNGDKVIGLDTTSTSDVLITTTDEYIERYACPEDFLQLTIDWCFHFRFDAGDPLDFEQSQDFCKEKDAILPAITSEDVTTALMLQRTSVLGISPFEVFYIGLGCDTKKHRWYWIDGPSYDPSEAFFSRPTTNVEYCSWYDQPFQFDKFGTWSLCNQMTYRTSLVVCATRPTGYSPPNPITAPCTDSWTQLPGGYCYHLVTIQIPDPGLDIYDAEMNCRSVGGHLPTIRSEEQTNLIQAYLAGKGRSNSQFWIGLYCTFSDDDPESPGMRAWIDGTPYHTDDYTNFLNENDKTENCAVTYVDAFLYNGAVKGKWQKSNYSQLLDTIMCTRVDPEPEGTTRRTTLTTKKTQTTTVEAHETTDEGESSSDEPENTSPTTILTSTPDDPNIKEKPQKLSILELSLIIILIVIIVGAIIIVLVYFLRKRCRREDVQEIFTNVQKRFSRANTSAVVRADEWEIRRQFIGIDYSRQLGRGAFGSVYLGRVFSGNIPDMVVKTLLQLNTLKKEDDFVAVKMLHETADRQAASEFLDEINIMKKIGFHERLVNLLACVTETEPLLLVVEYCSNGDLLNFMRERRQFILKLKDTVGHDIAGRHSVITQKQQLMFGIQIAYGMEYLSQLGFVHRDLAARNILVDANETCKIADFGLCRQISGENEQYISRGGRLPWKWMAPEALERFYFSVESDVWSFGVLLFEIITLGGNPYPDWPAVELLHRLKAGERMPKPDGCSDGYYDIMQACWRAVAMQRLSFEKIRRKLAHELEESSTDDYYLKLDAGAKHYQDSIESPRIEGRFNSF